jgi:eukaryotic-like serine/threonine-protein kinase
MALAQGMRLGPYEVLAPLGAGGMGEVWRARDTRLGREVAVKVLPDAVAKDAHALSRFAHETKVVAALSHRNILALFDVGEAGGVHYAVTELLEGETLRALISGGPLPVRRALEISEQAAHGLAAAHEKGIVHRDLKPENVFLTKDGHVKLLDFGLAHHEPSLRSPEETHSPTLSAYTEAGAVVGTVAYMSPEQARGLPVDHRSDQFSLGTVLYEMLAGHRPFKGASTAETLTAIIREEPEPLSTSVPPIPAPVRWLVERCLAKEPGERYDSTRDLAREFSSCRVHLSEVTSGAVEPVSLIPVVRRRKRAVLLGVLAVALVVASLAGVFAVGRGSAKRSELKFQRLTFKRGAITGARFAPDGRTVVYSATWDGGPPAVYSVRLDALDPVPSGYSGANLLAVSVRSQLALSLPRGISSVMLPVGTLALAPFAGGTPRELEPDISFADFSPDGEKLAIARGAYTSDIARLEYPSGTVLYKSPFYYLSHVRISPSGEYLAFLEHTKPGTDEGDVVVVDRLGKPILRKGRYSTLEGLAWSPSGDEVWFGGDPAGIRMSLRAVTLGGRERVVLAAPVQILPHDIAPDGRVLASTVDYRNRLFYRGEAASPDREISAQMDTGVGAISPDGSWVAITDDSFNGVFQCYLRPASGAPPVSLGPGLPASFSPDGRILVVVQPDRAVVLHPVGQGQSTTIRLDGFEFAGGGRPAGLLPDGKTIWFRANQPDRPKRIWEVAISGGKPRPLTPEGVSGWVTDDGASVVFSRDGKTWIQPIAGGEARPVDGLLEGEAVAAWTGDGKPLFVYRWRECPTKVYRLDAKTRRREFFREIGPADPSGVTHVSALMTPDGKACAYVVSQWLSELHVIEGLR